MNEPRELILLSQASQALEQASTVDEVKDLRDKAEAVKAYARKAKLGHSILIEASLIKVNAERKLGEILRETELARAAPGNQYTGRRTDAEGDGRRLSAWASRSRIRHDCSRSQTCQTTYSSDTSTNRSRLKREPTTAGLLRLAKQHQWRCDQIGATCRTRSKAMVHGDDATQRRQPPRRTHSAGTQVRHRLCRPTLALQEPRNTRRHKQPLSRRCPLTLSAMNPCGARRASKRICISGRRTPFCSMPSMSSKRGVSNTNRALCG